MEYKGIVRDGVVVLEAGCRFEEGDEVLVQALPGGPARAETPTIWQNLQKYSGVLTDLPADMARNHDHYIHGGPML
jgi:hypothetical protein